MSQVPQQEPGAATLGFRGIGNQFRFTQVEVISVGWWLRRMWRPARSGCLFDAGFGLIGRVIFDYFPQLFQAIPVDRIVTSVPRTKDSCNC